jgi:hypothetical protein
LPPVNFGPRVFILICAPCVVGCVSAYERCAGQGGSWFSSASRPKAAGVCILPAGDGGKPCRESSDCSVQWCECQDNPFEDGPHQLEDGAEATGTCATFPARGGAGWMCAVEHGHVIRHGIIVD